jgi:hypothetical protein
MHVKNNLVCGHCLLFLLLCLRLIARVYQRHPEAAVVSKIALRLRL